jgi:rod shape determining protein RodA
VSILGEREVRLTLRQKLWDINWGLVLLLTVVAGIGFVMLYSVANGSIDPWARLQMIRFGAGMVLMFIVALIDIRIWMRYAYLIYAVGVLLLVGVEFMGTIGMGAQRWIDLGFFRLQPSEVVKIALVLALARYFHGRQLEEVSRPHYLIAPLLLVAVPVALVLRQPDLGTAILLALGSGALFLLAGVRLWMFGAVFAAVVAAVPVAWQFLRDYQKDRILTFLEPERDPLGAGYHTMQSKIALGAGGLTGKGYMQGTQSHLNFLPEKHTDFIFTMVGEEFGLMGGLAIIGLYILIMAYGYAIAVRSRNQFGRLVALGITTTLFLYVFINVAMVMGLVPVVGVPLPMISFGGTAMMALLIGFGLVISVFVHRDVEIPRRSGGGLP